MVGFQRPRVRRREGSGGLGNVVRNALAVENVLQNREMAGLQRQRLQRENAMLEARRQYAPGAMAGDEASLQQLAGVDPEFSMRIQDFLSRAPARVRETAIANAQQVQNMTDFIGSATDPQAAYQRLMPDFQRLMPDMPLPEIWSPEVNETLRAGVAPFLERPKADPTALQRNLAAAGLEPGTPEYEAEVLAAVRRPATQIQMPKQLSEIEQTQAFIDRNRDLHKETGDPRYARAADAAEMRLTFGGNPPEAYVRARTAIGMARDGISDTYNLITQGASSLSPTDRSRLAQAYNQAKLGLAELTNRGANFTESEEAMIASVLGGDPNDIVNRAIKDDATILKNLEKAGEVIEKRGQNLIDSYLRPGTGEFTYPWQREGAAPAEAPTGTPRSFGEPPPGSTVPEPSASLGGRGPAAGGTRSSLAPGGGGTATARDDGGTAATGVPDGTEATDAAGNRLVARGGRWVAE